MKMDVSFAGFLLEIGGDVAKSQAHAAAPLVLYSVPYSAFGLRFLIRMNIDLVSSLWNKNDQWAGFWEPYTKSLTKFSHMSSNRPLFFTPVSPSIYLWLRIITSTLMKSGSSTDTSSI
jgi:hypothetical protein